MNRPRRLKWQYPVIAVLAAGAVGFGLVHTTPTAATTAAKKKPGATERIQNDPSPTLFTDAQVADIAKQQAAQKHTADVLFAKWKAAHGSTRDDKAFTTWVTQQVPAPPSKAERTVELRQVQQLAKSRTAAGKKAATWLELHGKGDIWKLYGHDQRELLSKEQGVVEKGELKSALKLAKAITEKVAESDKQPAPYVLDPALRPDKHVTAGQKGPYSYPSRHAAKSAAAVTLLSGWAPHRAEDYQAMAAQIVYSRLYMAGHVTSDITAGTLVGDLVGDYFQNAAGK
ncbi:phosphatase PAP2 family protein [Streptomyces canus]|uniref:phosphatase PAP2 family protein n=1 Tax=Streptomyces TaxID=1883 RepID=UPI003714156D